MDTSREPQALYEARHGLCYDRSRSIEKALALVGFDVRHVSVYSTAETGSALISLLTPRISSHAVTEVRTERGWMIIDSNVRWIALDAEGHPWSASKLRGIANEVTATPPEWSTVNHDFMSGIFSRPFTSLIGVYSRHGQFYPPFTPIPDINWIEFAANLSG